LNFRQNLHARLGIPNAGRSRDFDGGVPRKSARWISPQASQQPTRLVLQQVALAAQQELGKPLGQRVSPVGHVTFFFFLRFFLARTSSPVSEATKRPTAARRPPVNWRRLPDRDGTVLDHASK
jgi:hypothetical protein